MNNQRRRWTLSIGAAITIAFSVSIALAWTGPTQTAPNGNINTPINITPTGQVKSGGFWAAAIGSDTGYCIGGSCIAVWPAIPWAISGTSIYYTGGTVGIGTASPVATLDVGGYMHLPIQTAAPFACDAAHKGAITLAGTATICTCNGLSWIADANGAACVWNPDTTPPTVSITAPAGGATMSGSNASVTANASDNVGVVGVQFKLDGANLSTEDLTSPYAITWDTTTATNGSHTLTAVARDAAGNTTTSAAVSVTVSNISHGSQTFSATGADQYFTVPASITSINVTLKGAGGGSAPSLGVPGGKGGFTTGTIAVTAGQILTVIVGKAGASTLGGSATVYGGGGSTAYYYGGGGGGRSAIDTTGGAELVAVGGGGGGTYGEQGANGGGLQGATDAYGYATGGTQTAPGSCSGSFAGVGHNGGNSSAAFGGGGGGGWFGGSGGCFTGGAGGSGYCGGAGVSACTTTQGAGSASDTNGVVTISW